MATVWQFLSELGLMGWLVLSVIAMAVVEGAVVVTRMWIKHRERMAMIEKGLNPDALQDAYKKDKV